MSQTLKILSAAFIGERRNLQQLVHVSNEYVYLLDEQVFLIESHRKKTLKIKIADLEAHLEVFQFKQCICTVNWKLF